MMLWAVAAWSADNADTLLATSRAAEAGGRYAEAHTACEALLAAFPDSPQARTCASQLARWEPRRDADGSFRSMTLLDEVRRNLRPEVALEGWGAEVPTLLRAEAALLLARRALERQDGGSAHQALAPWLDGAAGDPNLTTLAASLDAEAQVLLTGAGGAAGTTAGQRWWRAAQVRLDRVALLGGAVSVVSLAPSMVRGFRWSTRPWGLLVLTGGALGCWAIAETWEPGAGRAVWPMFGGLALMHLAAVHALHGASSLPGRSLVRGAAVAGSVATVWLALSWFDGLQALGLPL